MPIRVKCTNRECGKVLTVKDELAGKRGKCPACGKILSIPAPVEEDPGFGPPEPVPDDNPFNFEDFSPASETQTEGKTKPKSKPALDGEDEETPTKKSPQRDDKGKRAAKKGTEDADELEDDEEEERPKRKKKKKRSKSALGSDAVMPVALGLGAGMLLCLGISATVLDWITLPTQADIKAIQEKVKNGNAGSETSLKTPPAQLIKTWEGKAILGFSLTVAVLLLVSIGLSYLLDEDSADTLVDASCSVAEGWSVTVLVWLLGFVVWSIFIRRKFENAAQTLPDVKINVFPSMGIFLGLLLSAGIALLFSYFVSARDRKGWIYTAQGAGILLGGLLAAALQPWDPR